MKNDEVYLRYTGKGKGILPGVPSRDLTYEEAKQHDAIKLIQSGLYEYAFENAVSEEVKAVLPIEKKKTTKKRSVKNG
jgi:hypothetical protein